MRNRWNLLLRSLTRPSFAYLAERASDPNALLLAYMVQGENRAELAVTDFTRGRNSTSRWSRAMASRFSPYGRPMVSVSSSSICRIRP